MDSPPHFLTGPETRVVEQFFYDMYIFLANCQFVNNNVKKWYLSTFRQWSSDDIFLKQLHLWSSQALSNNWQPGNLRLWEYSSKIRQCSAKDIWKHLGEIISILIVKKICLKDWNLIMFEHISKRRQFWLRVALPDK